MRRSAPTLVAALAIGSVLASAGPAAADGPLVPGETRTIQLSVPATWADALQVDVTVGSVSQSENDCLDPERKAGDDCGSTVGELAGQLTGTVTLGLPDGADCTPAQSAELNLSGTTTARLTAASAGVRCLFVELTFRDDGLNNRAQSDSLIFGLDLVARDFLAPEGLGGDGAITDGQIDNGADPRIPARDGGVPVDGESGTTESGQAGTGQEGGLPATDRVGAAQGAVAAAAAGPAGTVAEQAPAGPVLDRFQAQVSVGDDGIAVQTQAAETSVQDQVLTWGSLLLGAIALGWSGFFVVMRRRRRAAA